MALSVTQDGSEGRDKLSGGGQLFAESLESGLWRASKNNEAGDTANFTEFAFKTWSSFAKNPSSAPEFDAIEMKNKSDD